MENKSYTSETDNNTKFHINNCSKFDICESFARTVRPKGRKDFLLIYVMNGKCYLDLDSKNTRTVEKGGFILYFPNEPQDYAFLNGDNSTHIYVHFSGNNCMEIISSLGIKNGDILYSGKVNEIENYLLKICEEFDNDSLQKSLYCEGLFMTVLSLISPDTTPKRDNTHPKILNNIIGNIRTCADRSYNVKKWAEECGYSKAYFIQAFKRMTGMPPYQYLTSVRIKHAKELLLFTDMSVTQIGELCGYSDCNYFSRIFRKNVGVSPSDYRNNKKDK